MGTSFTRFRGHGFWSSDASMELWLFLLAREAWTLSDPPDWLRAAADDWHIQATVGMVGCVSAGLDEYATDAERVGVLVGLAGRALAWLRGQGEVLPAALLNSFGLGGPGATFTRDVPAEVFIRAGEAFLRLLQGEITWDAATSPLV
jgi:hypothetical protein